MVPFSGEITKEVSREIQECEAVFKTLVRSEGHFGQTPILQDGQAIIDFPPLIEKRPDQRWAIYFQIKKRSFSTCSVTSFFSVKGVEPAVVVRCFGVQRVSHLLFACRYLSNPPHLRTRLGYLDQMFFSEIRRFKTLVG